jgi:NAD(P)-dependent dehydrogenase (short-subunit alcohol dehydrogenase family)
MAPSSSPTSGSVAAAPSAAPSGLAPARGVALVTGAARRLGRVIALSLAQRGWDVAVHCHRSLEEAQAVAAEIGALGRRSTVLQADLADEAATAQLVDQCRAALGEVPTCLVNNASLFQYDVAQSFGYASLDTHMRTNVAAPLTLARAVYRALEPNPAPQGDASTEVVRGVVINLLDQKLSNLNPDFLSYTLSKAALQTATVLLAQALAPRLRVVGLAPGITMVSGAQSAAGFAAAHRMTPLGRSSTPEDIAQAVCYLAEAQSITGTTLFVDGGQHLMPLDRDVMFLTE